MKIGRCPRILVIFQSDKAKIAIFARAPMGTDGPPRPGDRFATLNERKNDFYETNPIFSWFCAPALRIGAVAPAG